MNEMMNSNNKSKDSNMALSVRAEWFNSRDNLPSRLKNYLKDYQTLYLCDHTIISIHPVSDKKFEVFLRNAISNLTFSIEIFLDTNISKLSDEECFDQLMKEIEVKKDKYNKNDNFDYKSNEKQEEEEKEMIKSKSAFDPNPNNKEEFSNYLVNNMLFKRLTSIMTEVNQENVIFTEVTNNKQLEDTIYALDCTSVYFTMSTSILFYPNTSKYF